MTNPRHARESENGRYYEIPGVEQHLVSVTNAISVGLSKYGLPLWYANQATAAAWDAVPRMVTALRRNDCGRTIRSMLEHGTEPPCDECRACLTRHIKEAAERTRDSASFLGSRVHELAEAHVLGHTLDTLEGDDEAGLYVNQYLAFLDKFDIDLERDIVAAESTVYDEHTGYAGTGDLWIRLPFDGFLWKKAKDGTTRFDVKKVDDPAERGTFLVDLKTSRTRAATQSYPENVMQLAALRHAKHMLLPGDEVIPNIPVRGAATLQLRAKTFELIPLPSGRREFDLFRHVLALADWLHHEWPGEYDHRPITPAAAVKPKRTRKAA